MSPDARLSRARGECRCPTGVCLYRSGNSPGYCREATTRKAKPIADRMQQWAEHAEKTGSATLAADLADAVAELKKPARSCETTLLDAAARLERMAERAEKGASWESAGHLRSWLLNALRGLSVDLTRGAAAVVNPNPIPPGDY